MNPSDAIEAIEKPLSSLPYSLSRHILEHLRKLTSHEPVPGIMGKSGAGKSSLCNALFQGEVTPVTNGAIVIHTQRLKSDPGGNLLS